MTDFAETLQQARDEVAEIKANRHDDERAHSQEDTLRLRALQWIAEHGDGPSAELARTVLQTEEIDFARWTA